MLKGQKINLGFASKLPGLLTYSELAIWYILKYTKYWSCQAHPGLALTVSSTWRALSLPQANSFGSLLSDLYLKCHALMGLWLSGWVLGFDPKHYKTDKYKQDTQSHAPNRCFLPCCTHTRTCTRMHARRIPPFFSAPFTIISHTNDLVF